MFSLDQLDEDIYHFLCHKKDKMPKRFGKWIALYYTDARVRKEYASFWNVSMGEGTYANLGMKVALGEKGAGVKIGDHVSLAPGITFICACDANNSPELSELPYVKNHLLYEKQILIEDNVWIGANTTIFPGVTIGRCAIVGAGSVVTQNVPPFVIVAGTPARVIRSLKTGERYREQETNYDSF